MSQSISLDGAWKLSWTPHSGAEDVPPCSEPIDALVPGDVHLDLVRAGILPEPLVGSNCSKHEWVERACFTYEREFTTSGSELSNSDSEQNCAFDRAELVFDGLDCIAEVYLDEHHVGSSANAFVPHTFDVTDFVQPGRTHRLRVQVDTGVTWGLKQAAADGVTGDQPERRFLRKSQFSFKWDWAPRLVTCGIWRSARLKVYRNAALRDVRLTHAYEGHQAVLYADAEIEVFKPGSYILKLTASKDNRIWEESKEVELAVGTNKRRIQVEVAPIERWWPAGCGEQALYEIRVELTRSGESESSSGPDDEFCTRYGFREVIIRQAPVGQGESNFVVNVNGVDVFCKGANWVPADSILARVSDEKYERLLQEAVEANFNMLRVWGGGIYESDVFYDLCDRLGIMIWHDFMFACSEYPDQYGWFVENVNDELTKAIKRLRHHACIVLWCGNNECDWGCSFGYGTSKSEGKALRFGGWTIYHEMLPALCAQLDPQRPYWPSSPYGGNNPNDECCGDRHAWDVSIQNENLIERADVRNYRKDRGKFISEYGVLSHALPQTIRNYTGEEKLDLSSTAARSHDNHFNNTSAEGAPLTDWYLKVGFGSVPDDQLTRIRWSLAYQAMGYREAILSFRTRKFDCAGSLFWMYSDCWGTLGWTIIDYYLRRKPSFYWVKRAYAPVAVFARPEGSLIKTYVVNDTFVDLAAKLTLEVGPLDGVADKVTAEIVAPANGVAEGPTVECGSGVACARIERDGRILSEDIILTQFPSEMEIAPVNLNAEVRQAGEDVEVTVRPDHFAHFVWIDHPDSAIPEDNYFNALPKLSRTVRIRGCRASDVVVTALNTQ